jgi:uroporphyrinogen-III decarboxylase
LIQPKDFVSQIQLQRIHIKKNHRYNYSIFKKRKVNRVNAVQIFDSWAECYLQLIINSLEIHQIVDALAEDTKVIVFGKDVGLLNDMEKVKHQLLVYWTCSARNARYLTGGKITFKKISIHQDYYLQFQPSKKT